MDHPEPLASRASTMAVAEADMSADSSVWGSGIALEAIAMRSWRMRHVAAQDEAEPLESASSANQLGEPRRRHEGAQRRR